MKKIFAFSLLAVLLLLITDCSLILSNMDVSMPSLSGKPDGVFYGETNTPFPVKLDVSVQNERLAEIKIIEHYCSPIGKQAEKIIFEVIRKQSLDVDVVSGATMSSISILKAIENALQ